MAEGAPFVAFPTVVPPAAEALDGLYAAFADWPKPAGLTCPDCFDDEDARKLLRGGPLRRLPARDLVAIFAEHIDCSVGREGFYHFLPRALETLFFSLSVYPDLTGVALYCGLARFDEARAAPVRAAAARAALGYFRDRNTAPFYDRHEAAGTGAVRFNSTFAGEAGMRLVRLLLALRVDPREVFRTLLEDDTDLVWHTIAYALTREAWLTSAWPEEGDDEPAFNRIVSQIAWIDFFAVIDARRLEAVDRVLGSTGPRSRTADAVRLAYERKRAAVDMDARDNLVATLARLPGAQ